VVSLAEFAASERQRPPIEIFLAEHGLYAEVANFLHEGGSPVIAMRWLKKHYAYPWATEKPLSQLRAKLREQSE
jgi:hypothetical protein